MRDAVITSHPDTVLGWHIRPEARLRAQHLEAWSRHEAKVCNAKVFGRDRLAQIVRHKARQAPIAGDDRPGLILGRIDPFGPQIVTTELSHNGARKLTAVRDAIGELTIAPVGHDAQ